MPFRRPIDTQIAARNPGTDGPMYCRNCGYRLDGLTRPRCPECSAGFSPERPESFLTEPPEATSHAFASVAIGLVVTAAIAAIVFVVVYLLSVALRTP